MSYSNLKEGDKERLATFMNIKDQKTAMNKIDWDGAAKYYKPSGKVILDASFRTSISRMKSDYARLCASDKQRLAACFVNINESDMKSIMANVDWSKATKDFKPAGKQISAASFRTSISRLLSGGTTGVSGAKAAGRKRKAVETTESEEGTSNKNTKTRKVHSAKDQSPQPDMAVESDGTDSKVKREVNSSPKPVVDDNHSVAEPAYGAFDDDDFALEEQAGMFGFGY